MTRRLAQLRAYPPIHLDVKYGSDHDRKSLESLPVCENMSTVVRNGIAVPVEQFIGNGLYREPRATHRLGSRALRGLVADRMGKIIDYFDLSSGTVRSRSTAGHDNLAEVTELIGVAGAISVVDALYGTTAADWQRLRSTSNDKTLDFERISNGTLTATVEAKARLKQENLSKAAASIRAKKLAHQNRFSEPLFGIVTVPGQHPGRNAVCHLYDPESPLPAENPKKYQIVNRLLFYYRVLSSFSESFLLQAIAQRIRDLEALPDHSLLDGVPLVNRHGDKMTVPSSIEQATAGMPRLELVGDLYYDVRRKSFLLFGLRRSAVEVIIAQTFSRIGAYQDDAPLTLAQETTVIASVSRKQLELSATGSFRTRESGRVDVKLKGNVFTTSAGVAIGEFSRSDDRH